MRGHPGGHGPPFPANHSHCGGGRARTRATAAQQLFWPHGRLPHGGHHRGDAADDLLPPGSLCAVVQRRPRRGASGSRLVRAHGRPAAAARLIAGLAALALAVSACTGLGPSRTPPELVAPAHYSLGTNPDQLSAADGVAQRLALGAGAPPRWWESYQSEALNALVDEGLSHNASFAAAQSSLRAAREQLRAQVGDTEMPSVDLGGTVLRQRSLGVSGLPEQTFIANIFAAQVQGSYTFNLLGARQLADRALAGRFQQQAYQLDATRRALAANIVIATINASSLQEQLTATERLVALGERRAEQVAARYATGSASREEMLAAEQDAANAAATLPGLRAQALAVRHAQAVLLGRSPSDAPPPLSFDSLHLPDTVPVAIPSDLLHRRPDILAAEAALRASADDAGAATAELFPSLTLSAAYGRGGFDWSTFSSPVGAIWSASAGLTQPLFHGGALRARKRGAEANYEAAVALYRQTVLRAFEDVADTLVALDEDANTLRQTQRAMAAAGAANQETTARYQLGSTQYFATLTAGQQYENSRVQCTRARAARLTDTAALFQSMGDAPPPLQAVR
ncbi:MAG: efflux transporter outer membrane subunit [Proteobacteria bacterium]|nr:efflux transporter outer membrane subunit [Pseudomonadota bacterium]